MTINKTKGRLILIAYIGFLPCYLSVVIELAKWEEHALFQNIVCPAATMYSVTSYSKTHCCVICDHVDECVSFFYIPDQTKKCHLVNVHVLQMDSCIPETNATYYRPKIEQLCNEDGEYRTVLLENGFFTYNVVHELANRKTAQRECAASGGLLAKLSTVPRMDIVFEIMTAFADQAYYWIDGTNINATDYYAADGWTWRDNEVVNRSFWGMNRPNRPYTEHCLAIDGNDQWKFNDESCWNTMNYICEKE